MTFVPFFLGPTKAPVAFLDFANNSYRIGTTTYNSLATIPGYTYTRSGAKYELDAVGVMQPMFVTNVPGIIAGYGYYSRSVLTNRLIRSQEFDSQWNPNGLTVSADAEVAPDGTTTADALVRTSATGNHFIRQNPDPIPVGATATFSVFAKAKSTGNQFGVRIDDAGSNHVAVVWDLTNGALLGVGANSWANTATAIYCGNGWWRLTLTFTVDGADASRVLIGPTDASNPFNTWYADTPGSLDDCYIWGAQLVTGAEAGPYIPTFANPVTIGPDTLSIDLDAPNAAPITNELLQSQAFDNSSWIKTNLTVTADATAAPDGSVTADALTRSTTTNTSLASQVLGSTRPIGTTVTFSVFAKAKAVGGMLGLRLASTYPNRADAVFDLTAGVIIGTSQVSYTGATASIRNCGNGWFLCTLTATVGGNDLIKVVMGPTDAAETVGAWEGYTGSLLSDCYVWGAQLVDGADPGPYIPTTTTTSTKQVDTSSYRSSIKFNDNSTQVIPAVIVDDTLILPIYPKESNRPLIKNITLI